MTELPARPTCPVCGQPVTRNEDRRGRWATETCRNHLCKLRGHARRSTVLSGAALACSVAQDPADLGRRTPPYMRTGAKVPACHGEIVFDMSGNGHHFVEPPEKAKTQEPEPGSARWYQHELAKVLCCEWREVMIDHTMPPGLVIAACPERCRSRGLGAERWAREHVPAWICLELGWYHEPAPPKPADDALARAVLGSEYVDAVKEDEPGANHGVYEVVGIGGRNIGWTVERVEPVGGIPPLVRKEPYKPSEALTNLFKNGPEPPKPAPKRSRRLRFWWGSHDAPPWECHALQFCHQTNRYLYEADKSVTELPKPKSVEVGQWWRRDGNWNGGRAIECAAVTSVDGDGATIGGESWLSGAVLTFSNWHYLGDAEPVEVAA